MSGHREIPREAVIRWLPEVLIVASRRWGMPGDTIVYGGDTFRLRACAADPGWRCRGLHGDRVGTPSLGRDELGGDFTEEAA